MMQNQKKSKKKLSIVFRDPKETLHRKGNIFYITCIGINCMAINNRGIRYLK